MSRLHVYTDGGARGNPGTAGIGVVIINADKKQTIYEAYAYLGEKTNNQSEYLALLSAAKKINLLKPEQVVFHTDSELMVKQIRGEYKVKSKDLKPIYLEVMAILKGLDQWEVRHVRRHLNKRADELANMAMDYLEDELVLDLLDPSEKLGSTKVELAPENGKRFICHIQNTSNQNVQYDILTFNNGENTIEGVSLNLLEKILLQCRSMETPSVVELICEDSESIVTLESR